MAESEGISDLYPKSRLELDLEQQIRTLVQGGATAAQVRDALKDRSPDMRTLRERVKYYRVPEASTEEEWHLGDGDASDAPAILSALAAAHDAIGRQSVTRDEAHWIARVARARPGLDPLAVYRLARRYLWHERKGVAPRSLDLELAGIAPITEAGESQVATFPPGTPRAEKIRVAMEMQGSEALELQEIDALDLPKGDAGRQPKRRTEALDADERERLAALRRHDEAMQQAAREQYERERQSASAQQEDDDDGKA